MTDREDVIGYASTAMEKEFRAFPAVKREREQASTVTILADKDSVPAELDALAATPDGSLVLLELKHSQSSSAELTQAPLQLLQYIWEWHTALPTLLPQLGNLLAARSAAGLIPAMESLNGRLSAAIVIDDGSISKIVEQRLLSVLKVVNNYLPVGVEPIQLVRISVR